MECSGFSLAEQEQSSKRWFTFGFIRNPGNSALHSFLMHTRYLSTDSSGSAMLPPTLEWSNGCHYLGTQICRPGSSDSCRARSRCISCRTGGSRASFWLTPQRSCQGTLNSLRQLLHCLGVPEHHRSCFRTAVFFYMLNLILFLVHTEKHLKIATSQVSASNTPVHL